MQRRLVAVGHQQKLLDDAREAIDQHQGADVVQQPRHEQPLGVQHVACYDYGDGHLKELDFDMLVEKATEILAAIRK